MGIEHGDDSGEHGEMSWPDPGETDGSWGSRWVLGKQRDAMGVESDAAAAADDAERKSVRAFPRECARVNGNGATPSSLCNVTP